MKKISSCFFGLFLITIIMVISSCEKENLHRPDMSGNYKGVLDWGTLDRNYGIDSNFTFNVKMLSQDHLRLTLNTNALIFQKQFDLYYDDVQFNDPNETYFFQVPDSLPFYLSISISTLSKKVLSAEVHYSRMVPGNSEDFTGRGIKY